MSDTAAAGDTAATRATEWVRIGLQFHDQARFRSPVVARAFSSAILASWLGLQAEVLQPDDVTLIDPDAGASDASIVRASD